MRLGAMRLGTLKTNLTDWACIFIGDLHSGARESVTPKPATRIQETLHQHWRACLADVKRETRGYGLALMLGGDMVEGNHHDRMTGLTHKEMRELALELLQPYATMADAIYSVAGTEAHAGLEAEDDAQVAKELGCKSENARQEHLIRFDGALLNWQHHGAGVAKLVQNETNGLYLLAKQTALEAKLAGQPVPALVMRHHVHRTPIGDSVKAWGVEAAICPCWKLDDAFSHRIGITRPPTIGAALWFPKERRLKILSYEVKAQITDAARNAPKYFARAKSR